MTDGNIHLYVSKLHKAVAECFSEQRRQFGDRTLSAPSLFRQLEIHIAGRTGERSGNPANHKSCDEGSCPTHGIVLHVDWLTKYAAKCAL